MSLNALEPTVTTILLIILSIFLPPLAVAITSGLKPKLHPFFMNLTLYLAATGFAVAGHPSSAAFIFFSIVHAIWVVCTAD
jgi:uncharacterized membrane protein YqaE (UPF0057 family)